MESGSKLVKKVSNILKHITTFTYKGRKLDWHSPFDYISISNKLKARVLSFFNYLRLTI